MPGEPAGGLLVLGGVPGEGSAVAAGDELSVSWPLAEGAEGYEVQWRSDDEDWGDDRRAVVLGLSYAVVGLDDGVRYQVRVQPAVVEVAEAQGARISAGEGSSPRARIVDGPPGPMLSSGGDALESVAALDGVVEFEVGDAAVWPVTIEIPLDMSKVGDGEIALVYYDDELEFWLFEPGAAVDRQRGVITAEVYHLTPWDVVKCLVSLIECAAEWVCERICSRVIDGVLQLYEGGKWVVRKLVHGAEVVIDGIRYSLEYGAEVVVNGVKFFWNGIKLVTRKVRRYAERAIRDWAWDVIYDTIVTPITGLTRAQCGDPALIYNKADGRPDTGPPYWAEVEKEQMDAVHVCKAPDDAGRAWISMKSNRPYLNMVQVPKAAEDIAVEAQPDKDIWEFLGDTFGHTGRLAETSHQILLLPGNQISYSLPQPDEVQFQYWQPLTVYSNWRVFIVNLLLGFVPGWQDALETAIDTAVSILAVFDDCIDELPTRALTGNRSNQLFIEQLGSYVADFLECHDSYSRLQRNISPYTSDGITDRGYDEISQLWEALGKQDQPTQKSKTRINRLSKHTSRLTKHFKASGRLYLIEALYSTLRYGVFVVTDFDDLQGLNITLAPKDPEPDTPTQNRPSEGGQTDPPTGGQGTGEGVLLTVGGPAQGQPGCPVVHCRHLHITLPSDWPEGQYTVECWSDQSTEPWNPNNRPWQWPDAPFWTEGGCWYGGPGHKVWVTVTGQGRTCRSNTLTWPTAPATTALNFTPAPTCSKQPAASMNQTTFAVAGMADYSCWIETDQTLSCGGPFYLEYVTTGVPSGQYIAVAAGSNHSCAIRTDQTLACWGANTYWDGKDDLYAGQSDPPSGQYIAVAAGRDHSCAIRTDQTLSCWGWNEDGQTDAPPGQYIAVAAGNFRSCAIKADQALACWGWNRDGLHDPPTGQYTAVSVGGGSHSCAIRADQTLSCWGWNEYGQTDAPPGRFTAIVLQEHRSCAIRTDQTLVCWGDVESWQSDPPTGQYTAFIIHKRYGGCAIRTDLTIACWGSNEYGQTDAPPGQYIAIHQAQAYDYYWCAVATDKTEACWGTPPVEG